MVTGSAMGNLSDLGQNWGTQDAPLSPWKVDTWSSTAAAVVFVPWGEAAGSSSQSTEDTCAERMAETQVIGWTLVSQN